MMFAMMHKQHQEQLNKMKEINKQDIEMAQQSIKKMADHMTSMYSNLQAAEKKNYNPNKDKEQLHQRKQNPVHQRGPQKPMHRKLK